MRIRRRKALLLLTALSCVVVAALWIIPRSTAPEMGMGAQPSDASQPHTLSAVVWEEPERASEGGSEPAAAAVAHDISFGLRLRTTHLPLPRAEIRLVQHGAPTRSIHTDQDGRFELGVPREVDYIEAWGDAFFPKRFGLADLEATREFQSIRWLEVDSGGSLDIQVLSADGKPKPQARIQVFPAMWLGGPRAQTRPPIWPLLVDAAAWSDYPDLQFAFRRDTGLDGTLTVPRLPCGQPLYVAVYAPEGEVGQSTQIPTDTCRHRIEVRLPASASLTGQVVFRDGGPAKGTAVFLASKGMGDFGPPRTFTDREGRFVFPDVAAGPQSWVIDLPGQGLRHVVVEAPLTDVGTVVVEAPATLTGELLPGPFGRPQSYGGLEVAVERDGCVLARKYLNDKHTFELEVLPGEVDVCLRLREATLDSVRVTVPCPPLLLDPSARTASIEFEVDPALPLDLMSVELSPVTTRVQRSDILWLGVTRAISPRPGVYQYDMLPVGLFDVFVSFERHAGGQVPNVNLQAGQCVKLGRLPIGVGAIAGALTEGDEKSPVAGAAVVVRVLSLGQPDDGTSHKATTSSKGAFEFANLAAGQWGLYIEGGGPYDADSKIIDVQAGVRADVEWNIAPTGAVDVIVVEGGIPCSTPVQLISRTSVGHASRVEKATDDQGRASFGRLTAGLYRVSVLRNRADATRAFRSRNIIVASGQRSQATIEFGAKPTRMQLRDRGRPFMAAGNSLVYTAEGEFALIPSAEEPGTAMCYLGAGPWIVCATSASESLRGDLGSMRSQPILPSGFAFARFGSPGEVPPDEVVVELNGPGVCVRAASAEQALPPLRAKVVGWRDQAPWLPSGSPTIVERLEDGSWLVPFVPAGTEILIEPIRADPRFPPLRTWVLGERRDVTWQ